MARTDHGQDLSTPVLQSGSNFRRTESGFDVGQRMYAVDVDSYAEVVPDIGDKDPELIYPNMFIREIEETRREAGLVYYTLNLRGVMRLDSESGIIKRRKRSVDSEPSTSFTAAGNLDFAEHRAVSLAVRDVYVTDKLPDLLRLNLFLEPPGWDIKLQEAQNQNSKDVTAMSGAIGGATYLSPAKVTGWRLDGISWDEAGLVGEQAVLYEVTEVYKFATPPVLIGAFQNV